MRDILFTTFCILPEINYNLFDTDFIPLWVATSFVASVAICWQPAHGSWTVLFLPHPGNLGVARIYPTGVSAAP
jgi:hypothetical protein